MQDLNDFAALKLPVHGAELFRGAVTQDLHNLRTTLENLPTGHAGVRINGIEHLRHFLKPNGSIGSVAARWLGPSCRAVRAILFDKTKEMNWSLGWHQDRTICVKRRIEVEGFGPWTIKGGMQHVAPPIELLSRMVTLRVHLDDVPATNAPLLIALGSHREGRIPEPEIGAVVNRCVVKACTAIAGDVWVYVTPILHASETAISPKRRRVLQIDYAREDLPGGLEWMGV